MLASLHRYGLDLPCWLPCVCCVAVRLPDAGACWMVSRQGSSNPVDVGSNKLGGCVLRRASSFCVCVPTFGQ